MLYRNFNKGETSKCHNEDASLYIVDLLLHLQFPIVLNFFYPRYQRYQIVVLSLFYVFQFQAQKNLLHPNNFIYLHLLLKKLNY